MKFSAALTIVCLSSASAFTPAVVPRATTTLSVGNPSPFGGKSLDYVGGTDPNDANHGRLSTRLDEADTERRKAQDAADQRERAAEIKREERLKKIAYMVDMPDETPAGTVDEFMFKEGVQDQLDKLDEDLVGLVPVKACQGNCRPSRPRQDASQARI